MDRRYDVDRVAQGKAAAKAELRKRLNLSIADVPIVAVVTRLTHQKVSWRYGVRALGLGFQGSGFSWMEQRSLSTAAQPPQQPRAGSQ